MDVHVGLADPGCFLTTEDEALTPLALARAHGLVFPPRSAAATANPTIM